MVRGVCMVCGCVSVCAVVSSVLLRLGLDVGVEAEGGVLRRVCARRFWQRRTVD